MCTITFELDLPADEDKRMEADDGTTYFRTRTSLYTFVEGARVEVKFPEYLLEPRGSTGNALYFYAKVEAESAGKQTPTHTFFKTTLSAGELTLEKVNEIALSEEVDILPEQPFYSVRKDDQLTVYRFEEKVEADQGRAFNISGADPAQTRYRNKLILTQPWQCAEIRKLSEDVLLLRIPFHIMGSYVHDSCHLLYFLYHAKRFSLLVDPENIAIHRVENAYNPPQEDTPYFGFAPTDIVSVRGDVILYTTAPMQQPRHNWRGKVPAQYFKK